MFLPYHQKIENETAFTDIFWNLPDRSSKTILNIGGNSGAATLTLKNSEFLLNSPLKKAPTLLPDTLKSKLPPLPDFYFLPTTSSGSFAKLELKPADLLLFSGELSKNAKTNILASRFIRQNSLPVVLAGDSLETLLPDTEFLNHPNLILVAPLNQIQKLFKTLLFPKMILLSNPLLSILETLHKFTLSYPLTIFTFHQSQIIIADSGKIITIPIKNTSFSPVSLFFSTLPAKIALLNLFNQDPLLATSASVFLKL